MVDHSEHRVHVRLCPTELREDLLCLGLLDCVIEVGKTDHILVRGIRVLALQQSDNEIDSSHPLQLMLLGHAFIGGLLCRHSSVDNNGGDEVQHEESSDEDESYEEEHDVDPCVKQRPHVVGPALQRHDLEKCEHAERDRRESVTELLDFSFVFQRPSLPLPDEHGGNAGCQVEPDQQENSDPEKSLDTSEEGLDEHAELLEESRKAKQTAETKDLNEVPRNVLVPRVVHGLLQEGVRRGHLHGNEKSYH
mmetsp:Transcript_62098/g.134798  ORF Transcript_62098/g.134798 Transcript_62098/m.134798 type:complete len:250 (+) Transcript_62098:344-1093(+)